MIVTIVTYFILFLAFFFTRYDINVQIALAIDLLFRVFLLVTYTITSTRLFKKFEHLPKIAQQKQILSIKYQFLSYLIGFSIQAIYLTYIIISPDSTFATEIIKIIVLIVSFVAPIFMIMLVHYSTF